jgi:hypothetical protein
MGEEHQPPITRQRGRYPVLLAVKISAEMAEGISRARGSTREAVWIRRVLADAIGAPPGERSTTP